MSSAAQLLQRHVDAGTIPGGVILTDHAGTGEVEVAAVGLEPDAIVRIQSMTKPVVAVAALRLVADGRLGLDDPVERWLPELAGRRVLRTPDSPLDDTVPARTPITVRHLLTCTSGYGMVMTPSPLQDAMEANGTAAGPAPVALPAQEWLGRLAELPLAFEPGTGWRYHHSIPLLQLLLARVAGTGLGEHLAADVFPVAGMVDTGFTVPPEGLDRLPAAYRRGPAGLEETEPAGAGHYASPRHEPSHQELASTVTDLHAFLRALDQARRGRHPLLPADLATAMGTDQVPAAAKSDDSFFPGFWQGTGWGMGISVDVAGDHVGRMSWFGGQGTAFHLDADGSVGVLAIQVDIDAAVFGLLDEFAALVGRAG